MFCLAKSANNCFDQRRTHAVAKYGIILCKAAEYALDRTDHMEARQGQCARDRPRLSLAAAMCHLGRPDLGSLPSAKYTEPDIVVVPPESPAESEDMMTWNST